MVRHQQLADLTAAEQAEYARIVAELELRQRRKRSGRGRPTSPPAIARAVAAGMPPDKARGRCREVDGGRLDVGGAISVRRPGGRSGWGDPGGRRGDQCKNGADPLEPDYGGGATRRSVSERGCRVFSSSRTRTASICRVFSAGLWRDRMDRAGDAGAAAGVTPSGLARLREAGGTICRLMRQRRQRCYAASACRRPVVLDFIDADELVASRIAAGVQAEDWLALAGVGLGRLAVRPGVGGHARAGRMGRLEPLDGGQVDGGSIDWPAAEAGIAEAAAAAEIENRPVRPS